ncbi:MAG: replicative DNA helicase [Candidatus Geothermincolia bacterium]
MSGTLQAVSRHDRTPPYSLEAEQCVLGSIIISKEALADVTDVLRGDDFYKDAHRKLYEVLSELFSEGEPVDPVTLAERLRQRGILESIGDRPYLHSLVGSVPTPANALYYSEIVQRLAGLRRLIDAASRIAALGYGMPESLDEALDEAESMIFAVAQKRSSELFVPIKDLLGETFLEIERLYEQGAGITGLPTGFHDLDNLTAGLQPSDLIIIAARPSVGKTSLALNIAEHIAMEEKKAVAIFSLEMSRKEVVQRMLCSQARVDGQSLRTGRLKDADWPKLSQAVGRLAEAPIYIDDNAAIGIMEMRSKIRRLAARVPLSMVIIDYIQLMNFEKRSENRQQEISAISRSLKVIGREFGIPVIALSQLSRESEKRQNHRPILSDLRESGAIEQDADLIIFIYRDELYNPESEDKGKAELIVAKHRNGRTDTIPLSFLSNYAKFASMARD